MFKPLRLWYFVIAVRTEVLSSFLKAARWTPWYHLGGREDEPYLSFYIENGSPWKTLLELLEMPERKVMTLQTPVSQAL